ncbi:MAG TPA: TaqI-like C-terminal specificity domain-containing protein [Candidatus Nitrosotenuis sp.]|nr:TaqI-like C-terminal specificity domain-containing protein [Candidatus Nitrosotenuis sp.]
MASQANLLFNTKTITRLCQDVKITSKQRQAAKEWLELLEANKLEDEKSNYPKFMQIILQDILGYPIKEINYEKGNVEFQFANSEGRNVLCFEAKGTSVKDLFAPQHRVKKEHETPIKQTWDYMGSIGLDYGVCTNYKEFVLITKQHGYSKYHIFDFNSIKKNDEKLKEFIGIFSKDRIIDKGFVEKLHKESVIEEREFTKEFYKLFHETRLMMIKSFQENPEVTKDDAIHYTQLYLNRLIFMFFAEDHDFLEDKLFTKRVTEVLNSPLISEHSKMVSDEILGLFQAMDKGSHRLGIFGFNGGLFQEQIPSKIHFPDLKDAKFFKDVRQHSKLRIKPNEETQKIINKYQNELNPIIVNLLMMDSFDFTTEVNVNILGHIFEQSISDLEELRGESISRRKKEGVYYTPEHITDYICRNTIVPYLSKSGTNSIPELIEEHMDNIEELEKKFKEIKILDPACGSGAFLVKAVDILLEIHKEIQIIKESRGQYATGSQFQLTKWNEDAEARIFVENNIYGVDINEESVEITKLSLFLKIASKHRKLSTLKNIKIGNSLISDTGVDPRAFDWEKEFPEVLHQKYGGFDIIVGNPPYFNLQSDDILKNSPDCGILTNGVLNVASLFIKKGLDLLRNDGQLSFIIPKSFLTVDSWIPIRNFVLDYSLVLVNDVGKQWDEVGLEQTIIVVKKNSRQLKTKILAKFNEIDTIPQEFFKKRNAILTWLDKQKLKLIEKIETDSDRLENISDMPRGITVKSSEYFLEKKSELIQVLGGTNIERYLIKDGNKRKPNRYLKSNDSRISSKKDIFTKKRIIYQNVASSVPKIVATIEENQLPTDDTVNNLILTDDNYSYEYILAILNSSLITFYLRYAIINNSELTVHLDKPYLGKIPIRKSKNTSIIDNLVTRILTNKAIMNEHNKKFFNRLQEYFPDIIVSKKLETYYEMSFSDFINEIETIHTKIPLKEKDEWEDYFHKRCSEASKVFGPLKQQLEELDDMIFKLYGISEKEALLIKSVLYDNF